MMIYQFNSKSQVTKNPASHHVCQVHTRVSRYTQACTWSPTRSALIHGTPATALQSVSRQERRFGAQQGVNAQPRECTASDVGSDKNSYIYICLVPPAWNSYLIASDLVKLFIKNIFFSIIDCHTESKNICCQCQDEFVIFPYMAWIMERHHGWTYKIIIILGPNHM